VALAIAICATDLAHVAALTVTRTATIDRRLFSILRAIVTGRLDAHRLLGAIGDAARTLFTVVGLAAALPELTLLVAAAAAVDVGLV
jgi:hypothetical protein